MGIMPPNICVFGDGIDRLTWLITVLTVVCLVIAELYLVYAMFRFHRKRNPVPMNLTGEGWKQAKYVLIPVLLVVCLDLVIDVQNADVWAEIKEKLPSDGIHVGIVGEQFSWNFIYPGPDKELGTSDDIHVVGELHVPVGTNVTFDLQAKDVLHSFWVPSLRLKQDALPGRTIKGWFQATQLGTYDIACSEICGSGHTLMAAKLIVQSQPDFDAWLASAAAPSNLTGEELTKKMGCVACHSADGRTGLGPTWKGLYQSSVTVITDGQERTVTADDEYLKRSILEPKADIVKGFAPAMPDFRTRLSNPEVDRIVDYLKTLK